VMAAICTCGCGPTAMQQMAFFLLFGKRSSHFKRR
jgi:hypothetical protein